MLYKEEVAESLAEYMDDQAVDGLGVVRAAVDSQQEATVVIETYAGTFLARVTKERSR